MFKIISWFFIEYSKERFGLCVSIHFCEIYFVKQEIWLQNCVCERCYCVNINKEKTRTNLITVFLWIKSVKTNINKKKYKKRRTLFHKKKIELPKVHNICEDLLSLWRRTVCLPLFWVDAKSPCLVHKFENHRLISC